MRVFLLVVTIAALAYAVEDAFDISPVDDVSPATLRDQEKTVTHDEKTAECLMKSQVEMKKHCTSKTSEVQCGFAGNMHDW